MSQRVSFRMARADYVALTTAVGRRPLAMRLATVVATLSLMVFAMSVLQSADPAGGTMLTDALRGGSEWYPFYAFAVLVALGLFFRHRILGFNAAMTYSRMPLADADVTVEIADADIRVTAPTGFDWRFPKAAIRRLIETPTHLIIAVGAREGVPVPKAAFASDTVRDLFVKRLVAALPEGSIHERT
ncbi:MAG: YcxB family protein [Siculibacillus sp.]